MQGYDEGAARAFILPRVQKALGKAFAMDIGALVPRMMALHLAYMEETGVLDAQGFAGEGEYDEDDAFEAILDALCAQEDFSEEEEMQVAQALDAFMTENDAYMEKVGLLYGETAD